MPCCRKRFKKLPISREIGQNLFHLRNDIALIGKGHLVSDFWMNDISGPAEVRDHRYGASCESFKDHACTEVANRWKHHYIRGSQPPEDLRMANPTTEGNSLLDPKGFHKLLKAVPLRAIAEDGEAGQIVSQKGGGRAQREITSFAGDQRPDEDQLKLGAGLRTALSPEHRERVTPFSGTKNSLSR